MWRVYTVILMWLGLYACATYPKQDVDNCLPYDYGIELHEDEIIIMTKDCRTYYFHADSVDIDEWIVADNL